jgi:hypothetical protein
MAGGLTPEQRWALIDGWGTPENAIDEALKRSPELQELWGTQYTVAWWPHTGEFWEVFWKRALPVLGIDVGPDETEPSPVDSERPAREEELDLGGNGYTKEEIEAAIDLLTQGQLRARRLAQESGMSFGRARRLWKWFDTGAAGWSKEGKLQAGPGLRWVKRQTPSGLRWTLIRSAPN